MVINYIKYTRKRKKQREPKPAVVCDHLHGNKKKRKAAITEISWEITEAEVKSKGETAGVEFII